MKFPFGANGLELVSVRNVIQLPGVNVVVIVVEDLAILGQFGREIDLLEISGVDSRCFGVRQHDVGNLIGGVGRFVLVTSGESRCGECECNTGKYLFHGLSN